MPSRSIDNDHLESVIFKILYSFLSNLDRISFCFMSIERTFDFCSILSQLIKSTSSERITTDQSYSPPLPHIVISKFGTSSSLTSSLQTNKHDNISLSSLKLIRFLLRFQEISHLLNNVLLNESPHVSSVGSLLHQLNFRLDVLS